MTEQLEGLEQSQPIQEKTKKPRMTKKEVKEYVDWYFSPQIRDEIPNWSNAKIKTEYEAVNGHKLSSQFIAAQKKKWAYINGEVVDQSAKSNRSKPKNNA